jgi:Ser/Thr protein kinase RdoA (MazF antagonist)
MELTGGNVSGVTRRDDTVLREQKPWSGTIHRLLAHLSAAGFDRPPAHLGSDAAGREILSFVPGETCFDYPFSADPGERRAVVAAAARLLRAYQDATSSFALRQDDSWMFAYEGDLASEVICHNDFAPYNVTFLDGRPHGIIDFDTVCPGPRIWDIAYALYRFVPLSRELYDPEQGRYRDYDRAIDAAERRALIDLFLAAYGLPRPADLFAQVGARLTALAELIEAEAARGSAAFARMAQEGHAELYRREAAFVAAHCADW